MSLVNLPPTLHPAGAPWTIPEQTMWVTMQSIQQTTGPHAPALLREAGLDRFLTHPLDPGSFRPGATAAELRALYLGICTMVGDGGCRLYQRNCGTIIADILLHLPEGQRLA